MFSQAELRRLALRRAFAGRGGGETPSLAELYARGLAADPIVDNTFVGAFADVLFDPTGFVEFKGTSEAYGDVRDSLTRHLVRNETSAWSEVSQMRDAGDVPSSYRVRQTFTERNEESPHEINLTVLEDEVAYGYLPTGGWPLAIYADDPNVRMIDWFMGPRGSLTNRVLVWRHTADGMLYQRVTVPPTPGSLYPQSGIAFNSVGYTQTEVFGKPLVGQSVGWMVQYSDFQRDAGLLSCEVEGLGGDDNVDRASWVARIRTTEQDERTLSIGFKVVGDKATGRSYREWQAWGWDDDDNEAPLGWFRWELTDNGAGDETSQLTVKLKSEGADVDAATIAPSTFRLPGDLYLYGSSSQEEPGAAANVTFLSEEIDFTVVGVHNIILPIAKRVSPTSVGIWVTAITACTVAPTMKMGTNGARDDVCASQTPAAFTTALVDQRITFSVGTPVFFRSLAANGLQVEITGAATATVLRGRIVVHSTAVL